MLENLRIAVRKQKKLVLIFFLTIFLPALTLSVFGVRAIRSERFRLARQEETEARRAAGLIRAHIRSEIESFARIIVETAQEPALVAKDLNGGLEAVGKRFASDPLAGQTVLLYKGGTASFPLLQAPPGMRPAAGARAVNAALADGIRRAETLEFVDRNYRAAAARYRALSTSTPDRNLRADLLSRQARCLQKAEDFQGAARVYAGVAGDYAESRAPSGLPLGLIARLQAVECYLRLGNPQEAAGAALDAYRAVLGKPSTLTEDQFKTYASLVEEAFDRFLALETGRKIPEATRAEYEALRTDRTAMDREWAETGMLESEIVPELERRLALSEEYSPEPYRISRKIEDGDILFVGAWIAERNGPGTAGVLGVRLDVEHLAGATLAEALAGAGLEDGAEVVVADLTGRPLAGEGSPTTDAPLATEYFEGNFPPWRIELFRGPAQGPGVLDLRRNFYFWTILTLVVVLAFGAFLIARTIGQEMEILKIKSDFVSSVSHEFKTPLTSIRSLMERLADGKVRDPAKMDRYFGIIAHDTERLTRLVNNLLDFSKIEEGKKEYDFAETDVARIAMEQVEAYRKGQVQEGPEIRLEVAGEIPDIRADAEALTRALANLLGNAIKFTPAGKAVRVVLRRDGEHIVLEVADEGIGIHPDEVGKVFEKFFQGRNAHDLSARGTGLGLTLVKHIAEAHGGRVLVESEVGRGSKFTLVLPIGA
ncbi:MAG TPA: HAMP domain-containing histidine kinase [Candidatus Aminicenantes bacterium]|nr:HAMP domain-containing histidine kinase [Candidatus Aminicenantes bacterium]